MPISLSHSAASEPSRLGTTYVKPPPGKIITAVPDGLFFAGYTSSVGRRTSDTRSIGLLSSALAGNSVPVSRLFSPGAKSGQTLKIVGALFFGQSGLPSSALKRGIPNTIAQSRANDESMHFLASKLAFIGVDFNCLIGKKGTGPV